MRWAWVKGSLLVDRHRFGPTGPPGHGSGPLWSVTES